MNSIYEPEGSQNLLSFPSPYPLPGGITYAGRTKVPFDVIWVNVILKALKAKPREFPIFYPLGYIIKDSKGTIIRDLNATYRMEHKRFSSTRVFLFHSLYGKPLEVQDYEWRQQLRAIQCSKTIWRDPEGLESLRFVLSMKQRRSQIYTPERLQLEKEALEELGRNPSPAPSPAPSPEELHFMRMANAASRELGQELPFPEIELEPPERRGKGLTV